LKDLNLPQFNPQQEREYLNNLKEWDTEVFEINPLKEIARKRDMKAMKEVLTERLARTKFSKFEVTPKNRMRKVFFAALVLTSLNLQVQKKLLAKRVVSTAELENGLKLYSDVAKNWLVKAIQPVLLDLANSQDLDMDVLGLPVDKALNNA